jgi:mono/diheme cytochrome c family protein
MSRSNHWWRYGLAAALVVAVAALGVVAWIVLGPGPTDFAGGDRVTLGDYHGPNPTGVPATLASADAVERGRYLARAADCEACHTVKGGAPFAGGLAFVLPFGTIYSTNITPDKETGIGTYSDADFLNALHRGVGRGDKFLYPAMPYASYTYMTDADALAIKAYLASQKPVHAAAPANTLEFPFNQRWLMVAWAEMFDPDRRFEPHASRSAEWNRGAYVVEALGHCGECHTPRNLFQGLDNRTKFAGALQAGWRAYNITADQAGGIGAWSDVDLLQYLAIGHAHLHGTAAGPMGEAVDNSLNYLAQEDIAAIVAYLRTVPAIASADLTPAREQPASPDPHADAVAHADVLGRQIFEGACASCHGWTGEGPLTTFATLTGARAVNDPAATNAARIVLAGSERHTPDGTVFMPGFGGAYSDAEIAAVVNFVTGRFGARPSTVVAGDIAKLRSMQ